MLKIDASKKYGYQLVFEVSSFQLGNDIYWVKGDNGSGKTTFLKMIAGLIPFEGDILEDGLSVKKTPAAYRQKMGWAEAEPLYPSFLTGRELISLYRQIRKASQTDIDYLVGLFNINGYVNEPIITYSTGMTKKLSLLLAFIGDTKWILLDEPFITLDTTTVAMMGKLITETHEAKGTGFIISSHQDPDTDLFAATKQMTVSNQTISCSS